MKKYLQRIGRSLMLPVAVLPAAAILMGIGYWIDPTGWGADSPIAAFLIKAGASIIDNIPILFAVGVALGMAKEKEGSSALSGLIAYLVVTTLLSTGSVSLLQGIKPEDVDPSFGKIGNAFVGIISGLVASMMYNRFSHVKLPDALSFFSGKRLVPIMTAVSMLVVSAVLFFVWPPIFTGLVAFGKGISELGAIGAGLFGFFNRLLIPTGLHHALNAVFWFNVAGINDIGNFWSGQGVKGVTGMYQAGFFPIMMFGIPAAGLAMYHTSKTKKKKQVASLMLAAGFAAFFTGVTEPMEFAFMFVAPMLYLVHAVLTGISLAIAAAFNWTAGFGFSAGLVDFILSSRLPLANQPYMLLVQGLVFAVIYYFVFRFIITKFNLMTPGREEDDEDSSEVNVSAGESKFAVMAAQIYEGLGGDANVTSIDYCATRLRTEVKDMKAVNQQKIKATGVPGINIVGSQSIQVIVGTNVQFVADEILKIRNEKNMNGLNPVSKNETIAPVQDILLAPITDKDFVMPIEGEIIPLNEVPDQVFSQKMMGDGFGIIPTNGSVVSPVDGEIINVFPTKHAIGIKSKQGYEILIHIGLDTVKLKGEGFSVLVKRGEKVTKGHEILKFDLENIKKSVPSIVTPVIFTNLTKLNIKKHGQIGQGQEGIITIE
jgi:N-acetylglucosamine PTS system EIICBA or EIICB component